MTLQNEHILLEEAHRRVDANLREVELDRFGREPRRKVRLAVVATGVTLCAAVAAVVGVVGLLP